MPRAPLHPVFVDRKTAADLLMISIDTFDTWLRAGFIPPAQIERGQIVRWHWPTLEEKLAGGGTPAAISDPFMEGLKNVAKGRRHATA
jgi:hypothetical protein